MSHKCYFLKLESFSGPTSPLPRLNSTAELILMRIDSVTSIPLVLKSLKIRTQLSLMVVLIWFGLEKSITDHNM
jgi:hypothetical protein